MVSNAVVAEYKRSKSAFARAKEEAGAKSKGTTFLLDDPDIKLLNDLARRLAALEAARDECKARLLAVVDAEWLASWAKHGSPAATPIHVLSSLEQPEQRATFVVQDRTTSTPATKQALAALADALELESAPVGLTTTSVTYSFNPEVLAIRAIDPETQKRATVQEMIARRVFPLLEQLVAEEDLTREQADSLLTVKKADVWVPGTLEKISGLASGDVGRLRAAVGALGSAVVRYVKPS